MRKLCCIARLLLALGLTLGSGLAAGAQTPPADEQITLAIVGGRLIDGYGGPPLEDSVILLRGKRIAAVGQVGRLAIPDGVPVVSSEGMTVMPGLIDLHVHFSILGHNDYSHWFPTYKDRMRTLVMPLAAKIMLHAGVTSARDLGSNVKDIFWLREQINSGKLPGPRTFVAGPFLRKSKLAVSAGYNDTWVVNDPEDARQKVRELVALGVDVIKTQDEKLSVEELRAIYDEARKHKKRVSTHLFTQPAIRRALQAGIGPLDTLEHIGDGPEPAFAPDIVQGVVESEVGVVPTEIAIDGFRQLVLFPELRDAPAFRESFPPELWQDIRNSYEDLQRHPLFHDSLFERAGRVGKLRQLKRAGARFYLGSDSGSRGNPHHMAAWREMVQFVEFGLTPMEIILAATFWPAHVLGREKDLGTIAPGKLADIIIVDGDPLQNMAVMERVIHVIQDGKLVR
ncbi:MAG: amidohydrolase family protein [Terriglobia bacterium]